MDWVAQAKRLFWIEKPEHFTNFTHCEECAEHDETLRNSTIDSIGLAELGNPGWDPVCFATAQGKQYYTPAFIRLSLQTVEDHFYFSQFLFHLTYNHQHSDYYLSCSDEQRQFLAAFIQHMILTFPSQLDWHISTDDALEAYEIWSKNS